MTIFLDYHIEENKITTIATMDDSKITKMFSSRGISNVVNELARIELVVVYERAIVHLYTALEDVKHYLDDNMLRKRWLDLHTVIRKETGKTVALSKIAKSTLGLGAYNKITRFTRKVGPRDQIDIEQQLTERLEILKQVFDYAILHDQLSFEKHDETIWVEFEIDENPIHSGI